MTAEDTKARLRAQIAVIECRSKTRSHSSTRTRRAPLSSGQQPMKTGCCDGALLEHPAGRHRSSGEFVGHPGQALCEVVDQNVSSASDSIGNEIERAFQKIARLALMREQASVALFGRLTREGFSVEAAQGALDRALSCGLIDDLRFAEVLIRSRLAQGRGVQGIVAELSRFDISIDEVPGWPDEFLLDRDDEIQRALSLLETKPPRSKNKREGAYRRLIQKGFGASVAASAARLWAERNPD